MLILADAVARRSDASKLLDKVAGHLNFRIDKLAVNFKGSFEGENEVSTRNPETRVEY